MPARTGMWIYFIFIDTWFDIVLLIKSKDMLFTESQAYLYFFIYLETYRMKLVPNTEPAGLGMFCWYIVKVLLQELKYLVVVFLNEH